MTYSGGSATRTFAEMAEGDASLFNLATGAPVSSVIQPWYRLLSGSANVIDAETLAQYPNSWGLAALRACLQDFYQSYCGLRVEDDVTVMICNGATHGLELTFDVLSSQGFRQCILLEPFYPLYARLAVTHRVSEIRLQADQVMLDPSLLDNATANAPSTFVVLNTPNNPSGMTYSDAFVRHILAWAEERNVTIVWDDTLALFAKNGFHRLYSPLSGSVPENVIIVGSASKLFAASGLRIGWVIARRARLDLMRRVLERQVIAASSIAQAIIALSLESDGLSEYFRQRRDEQGGLWNLVLKYAPYPGIRIHVPEDERCPAYCLFHVQAADGAGISAAESKAHEVFEAIRTQGGVMLVPGIHFGGSSAGSLRVGIRGPSARIEEACQRMKRSLSQV